MLAKHPPSAGFPSPYGGAAPPAPILEAADFGGGKRIMKKKINWGTCSAP